MKVRSKNKVFARIATGGMLWGGRSGSLIFLAGASALLLVSILRPTAMDGVRIGTADILSPVLSAINQPFQDAAEFVGSVSGIAELRAENAQLQSENMRLREWYQTALMLQAENQSLQELLNLKVEPQHKYVTTRVISDAGAPYVKSVLIAGGERDGIKKGQAVLAGEGMIGRIMEAGNNSARVLLLTDFNSRVPVLIQGTSQKAILYGTNNDLPILRHMPPDGEVSEGMRIVTSGHGGLFPPGLPVGRVSIGEDGQPYVKPFSDISRVTYVRVLDIAENPNLQRAQDVTQ